MKKTIKLPRIWVDGKSYKVNLEVELTDDNVFSVSGEVFRTDNDWLMCGQCLDELAQYSSIKNNPKFKQVYEWWKEWHLNDMHAGTEKQESALEQAGLTAFAGEYDKCCKYLESIGLLVDNGYKFGTSWLKREIPSETLLQMKQFIKEN